MVVTKEIDLRLIDERHHFGDARRAYTQKMTPEFSAFFYPRSIRRASRPQAGSGLTGTARQMKEEITELSKLSSVEQTAFTYAR